MAFPITADLTLRELGDWARVQATRLQHGLPGGRADQPAFVLAQAAKLAEEVGEVQAEVLGQAGYQRATKTQAFTADSLGGELADVMICVAILASSHSVDLGKAVAAKVERIELRHQPAVSAEG